MLKRAHKRNNTLRGNTLQTCLLPLCRSGVNCPMELLKTYLAALGGTATALLIIGFFGKALFEHWFNKALKRYEAELEERAVRAKARFEHSLPERAEAIKELFTMCLSFYGDIIAIVVSRRDDNEIKKQEMEAKLNAGDGSFFRKIGEIQQYLQTKAYLFDEKAKALGWDFTDYAQHVAFCNTELSNNIQLAMDEGGKKLSALEDAVRDVVGE